MPEQSDILTGSDKICAEIEGLSNPFKATSYETSMDKNNLILTIEMPNKISASGMKKLKQDLGDKLQGAGNTASETVSVILMSK